MDDERREAGMRVRRAVLGDAHVDAAVEATTPFTADFQELITEYAWADVWGRPGLDRRSRSLITVAMLATLGHDDELVMHAHAAIRNGVTEAELSEVLLQVAVYAGVPRANHAFGLVRDALATSADQPSP